jgi:hypothetical protein
MCTKILALLTLASVASAHMHLYFPLILRGNNNLYTYKDANPLLNYPYRCCRKEASSLCKGYLDLLNTDEGKPVTA